MAPGPRRLKRALSISEQKSTNECLGSEADLVSSPARIISVNGQEENNLSASFLERSHCPTSLTSFQSTVTRSLPNIFSSPSLAACAGIRLPRVPTCAAQILLPSLGSCLWKVIGTSHEPHENSAFKIGEYPPPKCEGRPDRWGCSLPRPIFMMHSHLIGQLFLVSKGGKKRT
jgi:hypothetical protein